MAAGEYASFVKNGEGKQIHLLSVNTDDNERLFREIVRRDGLDEKTQYRASGTSASDMVSEYGLQGGMQSFLIDPQGRILATNPDVRTIASLI